MTKPLRVLIVEDSKDDTELLLRELKHGDYEPFYVRVETPEAMTAELATLPWDIIFSDFTMPRFNAFDALALLRNSGLDLPFIIVSGTIGEDRAVIAMKTGAHDYILKGNLKRLVPAVERELREAVVRKERRQAEETIRRLAFTDLITELPNRTRFREQIKEVLKSEQQEQHTMALLLMDIDRFREVNDTLGHTRGDILLRQVGLRLHGALFEFDIIARLGGDEFGILLTRLSEADDVKRAVKKLQDFLEAPFMIDGVPVTVEVSIGIVILNHFTDADQLLQWADIAMYHAKEMASGYAIYSSEYDRHNPEQLGLMAELRDAIDHNQLLLYFQPKVEIKTNRIVGTEALVRWKHLRHEQLLMPDQFIAATETTGLINPLTRWVLTNALKHCQEMCHNGICLRVSVNLSARTLRNSYLLEMVENTLKETGTEPHQLILEITESAIMLDPQTAEENLSALSRMGVWLSIDDFGTGYTSLASIRHMPINEIKIDKSFVNGMLTNKSDAMIVRSVIELGHILGLRVVAEGVENKETFDALAVLGCDEIQGYFISVSQEIEALKNWFSTSSWKVGSTEP